MQSFYDKTEYSFSDVKSLIDNEIEESIYLDFKEAAALDRTDGKKKDISKDISSFANSDGGIIIYGIKEQNHKAHSLSYIDGNIYTKEWLEQTINSSIQRRIPDIQIFPVRNSGNMQETIYIVKIPKSYEAPHISKDKRFYKRFNFESVQMEEYEIRQLYGQKLKSKLILGSWMITNVTDYKNGNNNFKFKCEASVINEGDVIETTYKVNVYLENFNSYIKASWPQNQSNYDYTWLEQKRVKISANGISGIYPNESVNAIRFELEVSFDKLIEAFKDLKIEITLFYPNGEDKIQPNLDDFIQKVLNASIGQLEN
jgi:Putative DNA-binding domain